MPVRPSKQWEEKYNRDGKYRPSPQLVPAVTNADFAKTDKLFKQCCEAASVKPTQRQASKFRRHVGSAYKALPMIQSKTNAA